MHAPRVLSLFAVVLIGAGIQCGGFAAASAATAADTPIQSGPAETVAGSGAEGDQFGDGGPAVDANLGEVRDLALDNSGNLYIASEIDHGRSSIYVQRVDVDGTITVVAGGALEEADKSSFRMTADGLASVTGLAIGAQGELYIADSLGGRIWRLDPGGQLAAFAGTGERGHGGDGGPAARAQLTSPRRVSVGPGGDLYVAEAGGYLRRIGADGIITTVAGTGEAAQSAGDGGPAAEAAFVRPMDVAVGPAGEVYVADLPTFRTSEGEVPSRIRRIGADGVIATIAGGQPCGRTNDGEPAAQAQLCFPSELVVGADGTVYLADSDYNAIRMILLDGTIDSLPTDVYKPAALAIGPEGALFVADGHVEGQVHRVPLDTDAAADEFSSPPPPTQPPDLWADAEAGVVTAVAGTGTAGDSGDGGPAIEAQLSDPDDLAVGPDGTLYVIDTGNNRVRAIRPDGTIATVAGGSRETDWSREAGPTPGDGRLATDVGLGDVTGIDVASDGTIFLADRGSGRVRRVDPNGMITTVAGTGGLPDEAHSPGSGALADQVTFTRLEDVAVAPDGSLYVSDLGAHQVVHIALDGAIDIVAGTGTAGYSGDGGPAVEAELEQPTSVDVDAQGTLYLADYHDSRIRAVGPDGVITTIAGADVRAGRDTDAPAEGVPATDVFLDVDDFAVDGDGVIYVSTFGSIQVIGSDAVIRQVTSPGTATSVEADGVGNL